MICGRVLLVGAVAVLAAIGNAREVPNRRNAPHHQDMKAYNSPFNLRQSAEVPRYTANSNESPEGAGQPDGPYYAGQADEAPDDYASYDQEEQAENSQKGSPFGGPSGADDSQEVEDTQGDGGQGGNQGADGSDYSFRDEPFPADIAFNFEGQLPEISDAEAQKSNGFISGVPQNFPSLNDFNAFSGKFDDAGEAGQQQGDEGSPIGNGNNASDQGSDYEDSAGGQGDDPSFNSPSLNSPPAPVRSSYGQQVGSFRGQQRSQQKRHQQHLRSTHYQPGMPSSHGDSALHQGGQQ